MSMDYIPEQERPDCPACGTKPSELANRELNVWWCINNSCRVHQFQGEINE